MTVPSPPWFVTPRPVTAPHLRLFCFPPAGGGPPSFHRWPEALPDGLALHAVHLPGRGSRFQEPPYEEMVPLLSALEGALAPYTAQPFALLGHSLGAVLAFEVARALQAGGQPAQHLFVAACPAPQLLPHRPPLHTLSDADFRAELERLGGTPPEILANEELLELLLPTLRADFALYEQYRYRPGPRLSTPLTVLGGTADRQVTAEQLQAWQEQTASTFELLTFPGDHFFVHSARQAVVEAIGEGLAADL